VPDATGKLSIWVAKTNAATSPASASDAQYAADTTASDDVRTLLHHADHMLLPQMTVQEAISAFDRFESEALAVVDSVERRQVIGLLSEAHALRRYSEASERQRRELLGDI